MIDRSARKVCELGARCGDAGLPFLIGIADDCVSVRYVEILADQSDAKGRIEVVQEDGSYIRNAISLRVAQQGDAVSALAFGAGEPLYPASDQILGAVDRRFRTIALDHQHVAVGKDVARPWMLQACGHCLNLPSLRPLWRFLSPRAH